LYANKFSENGPIPSAFSFILERLARQQLFQEVDRLRRHFHQVPQRLSINKREQSSRQEDFSRPKRDNRHAVRRLTGSAPAGLVSSAAEAEESHQSQSTTTFKLSCRKQEFFLISSTCNIQ
jgi:hypothetical protein